MSFADSPDDAPTSSGATSNSIGNSNSSSSTANNNQRQFIASGSSSSSSISSTPFSSLRQCEWREGGPLFFDLHTKLGVTYDAGHWFHMAENFLTARSTLRKQGALTTLSVHHLDHRINSSFEPTLFLQLYTPNIILCQHASLPHSINPYYPQVVWLC